MSQDKEEECQLEIYKIDLEAFQQIKYSFLLENIQFSPVVSKVPVEINALAIAEDVQQSFALASVFPPHSILNNCQVEISHPDTV